VDVALVQPHARQQLANQLLALAPVGEPVDEGAFPHDLADGHPGVEGRIRVLEDDLHVATDGLELVAARLEERLAAEQHVAPGGRNQAEHDLAQRRLAAPGLADQS
jgi:hypothetical protein